jgi:hypothetical protein
LGYKILIAWNKMIEALGHPKLPIRQVLLDRIAHLGNHVRECLTNGADE